MHLRDTYKLSGQDVARHILVSAARAFIWGKQKCPFGDCSRETTRKQYAEVHLEKDAKMRVTAYLTRRLPGC